MFLSKPMRPMVQVKAEEVDELSSSPKTEEKPQTTTTKEYGSNGALEAVNQMLASLLMRKEKGQDLLVWKPKKNHGGGRRKLSSERYLQTDSGLQLTRETHKNDCVINPRCPGVDCTCPGIDSKWHPDMRKSKPGQFSGDA